MPEVILPCPAWACQGELVECKQDGENFFIECTECSMRGPVEPDPYHAQQSWDWIPRALRWTTEPPKPPAQYEWGQKVEVLTAATSWERGVWMKRAENPECPQQHLVAHEYGMCLWYKENEIRTLPDTAAQ